MKRRGGKIRPDRDRDRGFGFGLLIRAKEDEERRIMRELGLDVEIP